MRSQLRRSNPSRTHNEIVIDTRSTEAGLPEVVLAFFHLGNKHTASVERMAFLRTYELDPSVVPLVRLSLGSSGVEDDPVFILEDDG
jgi:hypothetical protein